MAVKEVSICDGTISLTNFTLKIPAWDSAANLQVVSGPNGSGKSTFIRSVLGIQPLCRGERTLVSSPTLGYVPQNYRQSLLPWMDANQNITALRDVDEKRAFDCLQQFQFRSLDKLKLPHQLSGGQCQRISLIRECCLGPDILLLDEPFSSLDTQSLAVAADLILETISLGTKVILVSHLEIPQKLLDKVEKRYSLHKETETCTSLLEI